MNTVSVPSDIQRGYGNADRPVTSELWARDSQQPNAAMQASGNIEPSHPNADFRRYYDREFAERELHGLWMKTWLYACREEDMPEVGDRVPFQVGPRSFFIVRSNADEFKAFYNSCLHRGTKLCDGPASGQSIRCPFHAWEWKIDGSLKYIPSHWDFKAVTPANGRLREVKLGRWGGFIFINADPDAVPLEEALGVIPEHFREYRIEDRYTAAHYRKEVPANWKIVQEAFQESYHVIATHPEAVPYNGDSQSQYDIWDSGTGHIGRQVTPSAVPSMHAGPEASSFEAALVYATIMIQWHYPDAQMPALDPTGDLRQQLGDWHRSVHEGAYGRKVTSPDAVMLDSTLYFMFPHSTFWLSESLPFAYQFTPHESDPEKSYFDVRMLLPVPEGAARPPAAPVIAIGLDQRIQDMAPAFGFLAQVFDQDMTNMPLIQGGVRSADPARNHSQLGTYQEMMIQHWNHLIDGYVGPPGSAVSHG